MSVESVLSGLAAQRAWQEELYIHLHQNPELSHQEVETAAEITRRLDGYGYETQQIGGGVVGVLRNGDGPTALFRADIDGLPVEEVTGLEYASKKTAVDAAGNTVSVMHACGHDVHIVAALGGAKLLAENKDAWAGTYVALFQPAEETATGANAMLADGLVEKIPRPDVALAQHVLTPNYGGPSGTVATAVGPVLSAGDSLKITLVGKGSHGSMPHLSVDPVVLASAIVMRLQTIVARELAPSEFGVVTVGSLQVGTKSNIIPESAVLLVNIRAYDMGVRDRIVEAIERIVRAECQAARCPQEPTFEYYDQYPLTDNDPGATETVTAAFRRYFGENRVNDLPRVPASEDFSNIPQAFGIPYCYWGVGGFADDQPYVPNHNPRFAPVMQPTLSVGTEAVVVAAMSYLGKDR